MVASAVSPDFPVSSGEIQTLDVERADEVQRKHELLAEYLKLNGYDALLIRDPANYSWLTAGGENQRQAESNQIAAILVTQDARVLLCGNTDSGQIFDRDLMGLGFLLKERSWTECLSTLLSDVCRGRNIVSDRPQSGAVCVADDMQSFRMHFSTGDLDRLRTLGGSVAHAVEATGRNFSIGATEAEVAGHLAYRLMKNQIQPVRVQVMADGQGWRYRHWGYGDDRIERHCVISVLARKRGVHVAATRTVCLGAPPQELEKSHELATIVQATGIYFSQPGWAIADTWNRVVRIYEKYGIPDEWRTAEQAELIGYRSHERSFVPGDPYQLEQGHLIHWHPSVRSSCVGDTFLITADAIENLTPMESWPAISVKVKGHRIDRPGILVREV